MNKSDIRKLISIADKLDLAGEEKLARKIDVILAKTAQEVLFESGGRDWYKARPSNIQEFNAYLAALMMDYHGGRTGEGIQNIFNAEKLPYEVRVDGDRLMSEASDLIPDRWTRGTQAAFKQFADMAGKPYAAEYGPEVRREDKRDSQGRLKSPWVLYAEKEGYQPTLRGMFDFWVDNIDAARMGVTRGQETVKSVQRKMRESELGAGPDIETEEDLSRALAEMDLDEARFYVGLANEGGFPQETLMEKKDSWLAALDSSGDEADQAMASEFRNYLASLSPMQSPDLPTTQPAPEAAVAQTTDSQRDRALASTKGDVSEIVSNYPEAAAMLRYPVSSARYDAVGSVGWYHPYARPPRFEYVETERNMNSGLVSMEGEDVLDRLKGLGYRVVQAPSSMDVDSFQMALNYIKRLPSETANARPESAEVNDANDGFDVNKLASEFSLYRGFVRR